MKNPHWLRLLAMLGFAYLFPHIIHAENGNWPSVVTQENIAYTVTESAKPAKDNAGNYATVVYLENLNFRKLGQNSNETDVRWLLSQGYRVIELDYANHENAVSPNINQDIIKINDAIAKSSFCGLTNCSQYQSYVLFEGYRIAQNVPYFKDDPSVYNYPAGYALKNDGDSLRMDIIYPANTSVKVPVVLSFSYSNSYAGASNQNLRLLLGYTLAGFKDSFLEGAPATGTAWAIADHPKYCPWGNGKPVDGANDTYKSYMVNPDGAQKVKSAIRTLRVLGDDLGLSGKIGVYGFSRGSSAGSMAVGDKKDETIENAGFHMGVEDNIQAAALGSGVFDFTQIYNAPDDGDKNLEGRCPWAWGPLAENYEKWYSMGSVSLVETDASAPVFFFYNTDDSPHYQDQIKHFKQKLDSLQVPVKTMINYGTGHAVPQTSDALLELYQFFKLYLNPPSVVDGEDTTATHNKNEMVLPDYNVNLFPNPVNDVLQLNFTTTVPSQVRISVYSLNGRILYSHNRYYQMAGPKNEIIHMDEFSPSNGVFLVNILVNGATQTRKIIRKRV